MLVLNGGSSLDFSDLVARGQQISSTIREKAGPFCQEWSDKSAGIFMPMRPYFPHVEMALGSVLVIRAISDLTRVKESKIEAIIKGIFGGMILMQGLWTLYPPSIASKTRFLGMF